MGGINLGTFPGGRQGASILLLDRRERFFYSEGSETLEECRGGGCLIPGGIQSQAERDSEHLIKL